MFDQIDAICVCRVVLKLHDTTGPSGLDALAWKHMCISFHVMSDDLCSSLPTISRRLYTKFVDPGGLSLPSKCIGQKYWCKTHWRW